MKVLHVLNELKPSGAETMLRSAAPYWRDHGVTCEILATGAAEGEFAEALRAAGYPVHHLPRRRTPAYFMDFRRFVRDGGYSLVHQHAEGASYWFGLAAMGAGAKLVRTVHNNFAFEGNLRWRRALQRRHLQSLGARFVAIAPGVQNNERTRFGTRSHLVWNWIDTDRFQPISAEERATARSRWRFTDQNLVLVSLGNCSEVKNHSAIIEALALTSDLNKVRYLHVGLEDKACSERQLSAQLGVAERVVFCGWMPNAREALAAADLYVMPSTYEGLGLAALEALGVGLPALLSYVNGLRDLDPLFPDLIYAAPTSQAIAQALRTFSELSPRARVRIALPYPKLVQEKFSVARGVREYCDIYRFEGRF
jgi:glycosyltransferase involved in cell wall biosynthesis